MRLTPTHRLKVEGVGESGHHRDLRVVGKDWERAVRDRPA